MSTFDDLPVEPDDEVVSAYVDGEATAEEAARVEGDPVLLARAAEFRRATKLIADPVAIDHASREAALAAALGASNTSAAVTAIGPRRRTRSTAPLVFVTSAAAVLVLVFLVASVALLSRGDAGDDAGVATSFDESDSTAALDDASDSAEGGAESADDGAGDGVALEAAPLADAEESFADDAADDGDAAGGADAESAQPVPTAPVGTFFDDRFIGVPIVDLGPTPSVADMVTRTAAIDPPELAAPSAAIATLVCADEIAAIVTDPVLITLLTVADIDGVQHVAIADSIGAVVVLRANPNGCSPAQ